MTTGLTEDPDGLLSPSNGGAGNRTRNSTFADKDLDETIVSNAENRSEKRAPSGQSVPDEGPVDEDLQGLIRAWPRVPESIKEAIKLMVEASMN